MQFKLYNMYIYIHYIIVLFIQDNPCVSLQETLSQSSPPPRRGSATENFVSSVAILPGGESLRPCSRWKSWSVCLQVGLRATWSQCWPPIPWSWGNAFWVRKRSPDWKVEIWDFQKHIFSNFDIASATCCKLMCAFKVFHLAGWFVNIHP